MEKKIVIDSARKSKGTIYRKPVLAGVSKFYPAKKTYCFSRGFCKNGGGRFFPPVEGVRIW